jgi:hypothetical protein
VRLTKEKLLAAVALALCVLVLVGVRVPHIEDAPDVPANEGPRAFRTLSGTPHLAPETPYTSSRDPFRIQDAWAESAPALLALPPGATWPRAIPGGLAEQPHGPDDRVMEAGLSLEEQTP